MRFAPPKFALHFCVPNGLLYDFFMLRRTRRIAIRMYITHIILLHILHQLQDPCASEKREHIQ